jgi:hypothetical protein
VQNDPINFADPSGHMRVADGDQGPCKKVHCGWVPSSSSSNNNNDNDSGNSTDHRSHNNNPIADFLGNIYGVGTKNFEFYNVGGNFLTNYYRASASANVTINRFERAITATPDSVLTPDWAYSVDENYRVEAYVPKLTSDNSDIQARGVIGVKAG